MYLNPLASRLEEEEEWKKKVLPHMPAENDGCRDGSEIAKDMMTGVN